MNWPSHALLSFEIMPQPWPLRSKNGFWDLLPGENPRRFLFLEPNPPISRMIAWLFLKKQIFPRFLADHPFLSRFFPSRPPMMSPRPALIGSGSASGPLKGCCRLSLADLARREHRHPHLPHQPSLRKDKSTAHRATHRPTTARKGPTQGESTG